MKQHIWSRGVAVYEGIYMHKCSECHAVITAFHDVQSAPTEGEMSRAKLPFDCDEAIPVVIHEEYVDGHDDPWDEEEAGQWGWPP